MVRKQKKTTVDEDDNSYPVGQVDKKNFSRSFM
jgi:hypothetical protein